MNTKEILYSMIEILKKKKERNKLKYLNYKIYF